LICQYFLYNASMNGAKVEGKATKSMLDHYKFSRGYADEKTSMLAAQICIANLVRAFNGIFTRQQIMNAVGDAASPNSVSIAVRENFPKF